MNFPLSTVSKTFLIGCIVGLSVLLSGCGDEIATNKTEQQTTMNADAVAFSKSLSIPGAYGIAQYLSDKSDFGAATGGSLSGPARIAVSNGSALSVTLKSTVTDPNTMIDFIAMTVLESGQIFILPVTNSGLVEVTDSGYQPAQSEPLDPTVQPGLLNDQVVQGFVGDPQVSLDFSGVNLRFDAHVSPKDDKYIINSAADAEALWKHDHWDNPKRWLRPLIVPAFFQRVKDGDVQVNLTWDTYTDVDLWVIEPDGNKVYYGDKKSTTTGAELDVDNIVGYGPENIFYLTAPASGQYQIKVQYYSVYAVQVPTHYTVTVNQKGQPPKAYTGKLTTAQQVVDITTLNFGVSQ